MDKIKIKKIYEEKINLLSKYNLFYYDKSNPKVSDQQYDGLKNEILLLEKKYKFLKSKNSPAKAVGHKPSKNFKKFQKVNFICHVHLQDILIILKKS